MLMGSDAVRREVLEDEARVRARLQLAARARHAGLGVDDDALRIDRVAQRLEREDRRGRVANRVGDERTRRREELRNRVAPAGKRLRSGMLEPVPLEIEGGLREAVCP